MGKFIYICGLDGSGKTTLAKSLEESLNKISHAKYVSLSENKPYIKCLNRISKKLKSNRWNEFPNFFRGSTWAMEMLSVSLYEIKPLLDNDCTVIMDRFYICNKVYSSLEDNTELEVLNHIHNTMPEPDIILYLDVDVNIANERIEKRGIERTPKESIDNLKKAKGLYTKHLSQCKNVFVIDGNLSKDKIFEQAINYLKFYYKEEFKCY